MNMENLRSYGGEPYDMVLVHGGPGAPGSLAPIAKRLSISFGILEPLILSHSVKDQVKDLHSVMMKYSEKPLFLIGHSWGAWLCFLYAAKFPELVKKVIMIGAPPFEEKYAGLVHENRLSRLTAEEKNEFNSAIRELDNSSGQEVALSDRLTRLLTKTDIFEVLPGETLDRGFYPLVYKSVWTEASGLRSSGSLKEYGKYIRCRVVAIHGDHDPHPAEGVNIPLSEYLEDFQFNLIEKCGHYPWKEKWGRDILYKILYKEMGTTCV
jgi:pimeloyl-ACP methyl ester carboxylesterase